MGVPGAFGVQGERGPAGPKGNTGPPGRLFTLQHLLTALYLPDMCFGVF